MPQRVILLQVFRWHFLLTLAGIVGMTNAVRGQGATVVSSVESATFYVEPGSYGTRRETDPPAYVRNLSKTNIRGAEKVNWLDVGLDYRVRSEWRNNDIRRPDSYSNDFPFLLRTRAYIGIREIIDPFRMVLEFEDASRVNGNYPLDDKDVNRAELIQGYGELHFKGAFGSDRRGNGRPFLLRAGRMAFEFTDRRLIGLNLWRNTTNNFYGLRASLGQDKNDWQLDLLTLRPIIRLIDKFDVRDQDKLFWAAVGHWRRWSHIVTIEPHYLALRQQPTSANSNTYRMVHSPGLRLYGWVNDSGLNYDLTGNYQFGEDQGLQQNAYAFTAEVGYKMNDHPWKPRVSLFYGYVSGDKDPNDSENNRFERFYGFSRPWSSDDYVIYENIVAPKVKVEIEPIKGVRVDGGYSTYSLASATDRFANLLAGNAVNRDKNGTSGKALGHGLDMRVLFKPAKFIDANIGYTHYTTGEFVRNRQVVANNEFARTSNFVYVELSANAFDLFKK